MAREPEVRIRLFPGLKTNSDPRDREAGSAEEQVNVYSIKPGQIEQRGGMREITFEE